MKWRLGLKWSEIGEELGYTREWVLKCVHDPSLSPPVTDMVESFLLGLEDKEVPA